MAEITGCAVMIFFASIGIGACCIWIRELLIRPRLPEGSVILIGIENAEDAELRLREAYAAKNSLHTLAGVKLAAVYFGDMQEEGAGICSLLCEERDMLLLRPLSSVEEALDQSK